MAEAEALQRKHLGRRPFGVREGPEERGRQEAVATEGQGRDRRPGKTRILRRQQAKGLPSGEGQGGGLQGISSVRGGSTKEGKCWGENEGQISRK